MTKKLLLTGALALSIFSASFAQNSLRLSTHSFFNPGLITGVGGNPEYSISESTSGDTIQVVAAKNGITTPGGQAYDPIVISVLDPSNSFANATYNAGDPSALAARNITFQVKATVACSLNIALQDNQVPNTGQAGYVTDGLATVPVTTSWTTVTTSVPFGKFTNIYSGNQPNSTTPCSPTAPCKVDSTHITAFQLTPNSGTAYSGTIWIAQVYLGGDSTIDKAVTAITAANPLAPTVNVYPNPIVANSGLVTINDNSASSFNITLTNSLGAVVATSTGTTINAPITAGMYFVTYSANGGATPNTLPLVVK